MKFRLDPRTKILLVILCILCATLSPSLEYTLALAALIGLLGIGLGKLRMGILGFAGYFALYAITGAVLLLPSGTFKTMMIAAFGLFHQVYPCGFLASITISTTKVNEYLAAMNRMKMPKTLSISLAVMLRYLPAVREDWRFIKDAMRLRDVSPSLKGFVTHPVMTVECIYVPLMMSASKAADELSIAAVTRGIENPKPRTSITEIHFCLYDFVAVIAFAAYFAAGRFL